jgi:carboxyvinyl-carboxyphosphonate phosphorylmutase
MKWSDRRARFRALLEGADCIYPASVFDPVSVRIAHDLGFELGMLGGSVASYSVLGAPDIIVLTLTELAERCRRISEAAELPLLVDADHGYGNAMSVMRTIEELEVAGVAGLTIEDTTLPTAYGAAAQGSLISLEEGVGKMRAAVQARRDRDFAILGRTSALGMVGIDEMLRRIRAYEAAGVDGICVTHVRTEEHLEAAASAVRLPLMLGPIGPALMGNRALLAKHRVRICLQGHQPFMAAVQAVHDTLSALRNGTAPDALPGIASNALMRQVTRAADVARWETDFLGTKA